MRAQRAEVRTAFQKALQRSLPKAPLADLLWRMEFVWGALAFALCNPRKIEIETHGACDLARDGRGAGRDDPFLLARLPRPGARHTETLT